MKILVIIPTYNERQNIGRLIPEVLAQDPRLDILVVDDNSPDGTAAVVRAMMEGGEPRLQIMERPGKMGLGSAYVAGFKYALDHNYDAVLQMDADLSHDPKEIPNFLSRMEEFDIVQGSRYITGVNVVNWPMRRLLLSYFANFYTRTITGMPVMDSTGGFRLLKRKVIETIELDRIKSNGYSFQIEMIFKGYKKGFRIKEIPIIFVDRQMGKSKMSKKIIREAVFLVWKLRLQSIFGTL